MKKFLVAFAMVGLTGCSLLPAMGPGSADVVKEQTSSDVQRYEVVDISGGVTSSLKRRHPDSSLVGFGDYRPSVEVRIGVGDTIAVTIWEASDGGLFSSSASALSATSAGSRSASIPPQVVGRDGTITVPYAGPVRVAGQTLHSVQRVIEKALEGKALQPQVLVNVTKSVANTATVLGEVNNAARVPLSAKGDRVLDVIAEAGGVRTPINETFVQLARGHSVARVAMTRVTADARQNVFVRPDDVVTVIRDPQKFIAYGATGRNAEIPFDAEGLSLAQAIAKAGGLLDERADPTGVFVFRYESATVAGDLVPNSSLIQSDKLVPIVYRLDLRDPNSLFEAQNFRIFNRDLVYVSNAPFTEVQKVMQVFNLATSQVGVAATVRNGF